MERVSGRESGGRVVRKRLFGKIITAVLTGAFLTGCAGPWMVPEEQGAAELVAGPEQAVEHDTQRNVDYAFRCGDTYLEVYDGEEFHPVYLNGVNIGSGYPGYYPGELAIPEETYLRWFQEISEMNCNTIRIYTTMMPSFYNAFYTYNYTADADHKLYLLMGVWYDEEKIEETGDAFDLLEGAVSEAKEQIDIIHGNCEIAERPGRAHGVYTKDVSEYVMGWILGIESDAYLVGTTNELHPDLHSYDGEYLYTEGDDIQAFDAFLCELGDEVIGYESSRYNMQRPVSWTNWPTADALEHPSEPAPDKEDAVTINVERFRTKDSFAPGIFASYHVYPYYPDFMYLDVDYNTYLDQDGVINTYEAYLKELRQIHTVPVLVAEFGVPSSRGCTHINPYTGLDQGKHTEEEQGWCLDAMARDIYNNGYAGGLIFAWQDEWFKRTWNTMDYTDPDRRAFWNDLQTSEQNFGLLEFVPGDGSRRLDGDLSEWQGGEPVAEKDGLKLYADTDARYLWLALEAENADLYHEQVLIPFDITPLSGAMHYGDYAFDRPVDFVAELNGAEESYVRVHQYYDRYAFFYQKYDNLLDVTGYDDPANETFGPIYLSLNKAFTQPETGETFDALKYDTGVLKVGVGVPDAEEYDSLADLCYGENGLELRLPWEMLNFRDPSSKEIEDDFWKNGELSGRDISEIWLGAYCGKKHTDMVSYTWADWDHVEFTERRKDSYWIMQGCFGELSLTE